MKTILPLSSKTDFSEFNLCYGTGTFQPLGRRVTSPGRSWGSGGNPPAVGGKGSEPQELKNVRIFANKNLILSQFWSEFYRKICHIE